MPSLPVSTDLTGSSITEAQAKTWFTQLRDFLSGILGTAGTVPNALATLRVPFGQGVEAKTGAYTVVAGDRGKVISCTGTWSLSLTASATLGNGFMISVVNTGSGVITIDPSGAELIDGASTLGIPAGSSAVLVCTGAAWITVGRSLIVTPGYRHAAGSAIYRASDGGCVCADNTSYESIPGYGGFNTLTIDTAAFGWFKTTGVHADRVAQIDHPGIVTASVQLKRAVSSGTAYVRVCKNGAVVQEFNQTSESYITYAVNVSVQPGDIITFQKKSSSSTSGTSSTRYHRILVTQPT